jgi:SAM-dependent methyltransferase
MESLYRTILGDFEHVLAADTSATMSARGAKGEFHFIPLDMDNFVELFDFAYMAITVGREPGPVKFIDVGCGIGTKVLAAQKSGRFGYDVEAYGIDKEPRYVKAARSLLAVTKGRVVAKERIIEGDALKHNYGAYDILYFYRPLSNAELQAKLELRILSTMKKGAIICAVGAQSPDLGWRRDPASPSKRVRELYEHKIFQRINAE